VTYSGRPFPRVHKPLTTHRHRRMSRLLSQRSWTGNHVLLPSYSRESRMMDQEAFSTLSQASFASWSLGRYTVVMSRSKSRPVSAISLISRSKDLEDLAGSALLHSVYHRWREQSEIYDPAFRRHLPPTHSPAVVYISLRTEYDLSVPNVLITVLVCSCCHPVGLSFR